MKAGLAELLLRRGAKVDAKAPNGNTPFLFAVDTGLVDVARNLVEEGSCDVHATTFEQEGKPKRNAADMCWSSSGNMKRYIVLFYEFQRLCATSLFICAQRR